MKEYSQFELERLAKKQKKYVRVVRVTIPESMTRIEKDQVTGDLYVDGDKRVALIHMVVGLLSHHWAAEGAWETRFQMETSTAILSPNIRAQLAGTKRIQQVFQSRIIPEVTFKKINYKNPVRKTFFGSKLSREKMSIK